VEEMKEEKEEKEGGLRSVFLSDGRKRRD